MPENYTLDASTFLNAFNSTEIGHLESLRLRSRIRAHAYPIVVPTLLVVEVAAAIVTLYPEEALAVL